MCAAWPTLCTFVKLATRAADARGTRPRPYASGSREANVVGTAIATTSSTAASMSWNAGRSAIRHDARGIAFATRAVSCAPAPSEGFQVIT